MKHFTTKLAALVTIGMMAGADVAKANDVNFSNITENIGDSTSNLPNLISTVAYVGGIGLGVAGIFKLKQHVDQPGQHPMKDGLVRLGAGGGLLALPFMSKAMQGTIAGGENSQFDPNVNFGAADFNSAGGGGN